LFAWQNSHIKSVSFAIGSLFMFIVIIYHRVRFYAAFPPAVCVARLPCAFQYRAKQRYRGGVNGVKPLDCRFAQAAVPQSDKNIDKSAKIFYIL